jgi:hypothetical protein
MKRRLLALGTACILGGCSTQADLKSAQSYIPIFHQRLNAGDDAGIYTDTADELKRTTSATQFATFLAAVHRKLGTAGPSSVTATNVTLATGGTLIALGTTTQFAKDQATENFTFKVEHGGPKLVGYHVNSNALILN